MKCSAAGPRGREASPPLRRDDHRLPAAVDPQVREAERPRLHCGGIATAVLRRAHRSARPRGLASIAADGVRRSHRPIRHVREAERPRLHCGGIATAVGRRAHRVREAERPRLHCGTMAFAALTGLSAMSARPRGLASIAARRTSPSGSSRSSPRGREASPPLRRDRRHSWFGTVRGSGRPEASPPLRHGEVDVVEARRRPVREAERPRLHCGGEDPAVEEGPVAGPRGREASPPLRRGRRGDIDRSVGLSARPRGLASIAAGRSSRRSRSSVARSARAERPRLHCGISKKSWMLSTGSRPRGREASPPVRHDRRHRRRSATLSPRGREASPPLRPRRRLRGPPRATPVREAERPRLHCGDGPTSNRCPPIRSARPRGLASIAAAMDRVRRRPRPSASPRGLRGVPFASIAAPVTSRAVILTGPVHAAERPRLHCGTQTDIVYWWEMEVSARPRGLASIAAT